MEVEAKLKYVRISPKKVREVARTVVGKSANQAVSQLECVCRKSSRLLVGVLKSAIANAENNNGLLADNLVVSRILVEDGPALRRFIPAARGSAHPIKKRMSHIRIMLKELN